MELGREEKSGVEGEGLEECGREIEGELAQLARASALQAEGQRFESVILHWRYREDR